MATSLQDAKIGGRRYTGATFGLFFSTLIIISLIRIKYARLPAINLGAPELLAGIDTYLRHPVSSSTSTSPRFVIHVGPPKTGTTSLQCALSSHRAQLFKDKYYYIGKYTCPETKDNWAQTSVAGLFTSCLSRMATAMSNNSTIPECWIQNLEFLQKHYDQGHNIIISEEVIGLSAAVQRDGYPWELLKSLLSQWQVTVVVAHRHYFDWLPSTYNQVFKPTKAKRKLKLWPDKNGRRVPTFESYFGLVRNRGYADYPSPMRSKNDFEKHFNTSIFEVPPDTDMITQFFCHVLPDAYTTCEVRLRANVTEDSYVQNPSVSLQYDMVAFAAYEKGLIDKNCQRIKVSLAAQKYQEEELHLAAKDFPSTCLSSGQEADFFNVSLKHDKIFFPALHASGDREAELRAVFDSRVEGRKFCSVDTGKVLEDDRWCKFFSSLRP